MPTKRMKSLKEHWKKAVQTEMEERMRKLREFMENSPADMEAVPTVDFMRRFPYELWDDMKITRKLSEYLGKGYDEEKAFATIVRPWMKAVRLLLEFVTARDYGTEGAGVGRETYIFSWNLERFVSQWWQSYLDAVGLEGVTAIVPRNSYGVNLGQLVLEYKGCRVVLWEWNRDTYLCPYAGTDEDFAERRCPDCRFLKFRRLTLSAIVEYLVQMPSVCEKAGVIKSVVSSCFSE